MELGDILENVSDSKSFLEFVELLIADRRKETGQPVDPCGRGIGGWENHTIEDFLEAAVQWASDSDFGESQDLAGASPWKRFATFLWCGKIYE